MNTTNTHNTTSFDTDNQVRILDSLMAVNLNINVWSGRKKLTRTDVGDADLPPEDLASLGSKRMCNPEDLKIFGTLRQRAYSVLDKHGVRFLGGWAIPNDKAEDIAQELRDVRAEFQTEKDAYMGRYEDAIQEWIAAHMEWANIFTDSAVSADYVRSRLGFKWQFYRVEAAQIAASEMEEEISGLGCQLFSEVSQMASQTWNQQLQGRTEIQQRTLNALKVMRSKVLGLSFLDYRAMPIIQLMDNVLNQCPTNGSITGMPLMTLQGLVCMMKDAEALLIHAQRVAEGLSATSILDELLDAQGLPPTPLENAISGETATPAMPELDNTPLGDLLMADTISSTPPSIPAPILPAHHQGDNVQFGLW